jgi:hypothetical protein
VRIAWKYYMLPKINGLLGRFVLEAGYRTLGEDPSASLIAPAAKKKGSAICGSSTFMKQG